MFFVAAGFYLIGNLVFVIFGKAELQTWNELMDVDKAEKCSAKGIGNIYSTFNAALRLHGTLSNMKD